MRAAMQLLHEYRNYASPGWGGNSEDPITLSTRLKAARFLNRWPIHYPKPDIAPGADGSIGMEWEIKGRAVYLDFIEGKANLWAEDCHDT